MRKWLLICLILLMPIVKVDALYCQYNDLARLKKMAANITTTYEYTVSDKAIFSITLFNLHPSLYVVDTTNNKTYNYQNNELILNNYNGGQTVIYKVYTNQSDCSKELLTTIRVVLPTYNIYYQDKICEGLNNYELCQKWSSHNLSYNDFIKNVTAYKESLKVDVPDVSEPVTKIKDNIINKVVAFILDYYYLFLIIVIAGSGIGIIKINKKDNLYN
ncbi:MAG: hypothetical protein RSB71_00355 [Bacilli bacterium]